MLTATGQTNDMLKSNPIQPITFLIVLLVVCGARLSGQGVDCDPTKVMTAESCATCHANEVNVWKQTPHFTTFEQLSRRPRAKEICKKLGLRSVKRSDKCIKCHFTAKETNGRNKAVSGISCESCHGASRDWLTLHNDYGGPTATKASETSAHRDQRLSDCSDLGMRNTRNLYSIASSCLNCHLVPDEELVNVGGHLATTSDFELVSWSQGMVRHNFLRGDNQKNVESTPEKLRVMFVVGIIADLEYSTRATAIATSQSKYGLTVAERAAKKAIQLHELQKELNNPDIQQMLLAFARAQLKINNEQQLNQIADQIGQIGRKFARDNDGSLLAAVDRHLPDKSSYKWKSDR